MLLTVVLLVLVHANKPLYHRVVLALAMHVK